MSDKRHAELSKYVGTGLESTARVFIILLSVAVNEGCRTPLRGREIDRSAPLEKIYDKNYLGETEVFEWPGMAGGEDYSPSGTDPLITKTHGDVNYREVSGGFGIDTKLETKFGTFFDQVDEDDIEDLLKKHQDKLRHAKDLQPTLKKVLRDKYIFSVFRIFLEKYNGELEAWPNGGKYDNEGQKRLNVGMNAPDTTFVHELLHFVFDAYDSDTMEHPNGDGGHAAIRIIVDRFLLLQQIREGQPPVNDETTVFRMHNKDLMIRTAIDRVSSGNLRPSDFREAIETKEVYRQMVERCMVPVLSANEFGRNNRLLELTLSNDTIVRIFEKKNREEAEPSIDSMTSQGKTYYDIAVKDARTLQVADIEGTVRGMKQPIEEIIPPKDRPEIESKLKAFQTDRDLGRSKIFSAEEVQDMAFMNAFNSVILIESYRLASIIAERNSIPVDTAFGDKTYQKIFSKFIQEFTDEMDEDPTLPARFIGKDIMDELMASL